MDIYKTDQYKEVFDPYPAEVNLRQRLYMEVKADSKDSHLVLFAQKCYATPTNKLDDKTSYAFIQEGLVQRNSRNKFRIIVHLYVL